MSVRVQELDFDLGAEYAALRSQAKDIGAIVTFSGLVREFDNGERLQAMSLEHYPGMTEKALQKIEQQARERWRLDQVSIIHRVGRLAAQEQIVFVGVSSAHRKDAFEAAQFVMDYLKTQAPFWKKEITDNGEQWVEAKSTDDEAAKRW